MPRFTSSRRSQSYKARTKKKPEQLAMSGKQFASKARRRAAIAAYKAGRKARGNDTKPKGVVRKTTSTAQPKRINLRKDDKASTGGVSRLNGSKKVTFKNRKPAGVISSYARGAVGAAKDAINLRNRAVKKMDKKIPSPASVLSKYLKGLLRARRKALKK